LKDKGGEVSATVADDGRQTTRPQYRKLRPARGRSGPKVAAHQRARIHGAMIELVVDRGYDAVTVRQLVQRAGVSTRAFYQQFDTKDECFLATYDLLMGRTARRIAAAYEGERDWRRRLRLAFFAFAREAAEDPQVARFVLVEAPGVGPDVVNRLGHASEVFGAMLNQCFARGPEGIELPPLLIRGMVAGLTRVIRAHLLDGRDSELPALAEEMLEWALCIRSEAAMELDYPGSGALAAPVDGGGQLGGTDRKAPGDDRTLILSAAARLGASDGYGELSIPRIRAAAGVSRKSFDAHFASVKDCFLDALELRVEEAFADAASQRAGSRTWPAAVYRTLAAICVHIARDPVRARFVFVEVFAAGPDGVRRRARLVSNVAEYLMSRAPAGQRPTQLAAEASVGAVWGILHHQIVTENTERLPRLAATLSYLVLAPMVGPSSAVREIHEEEERARSAP
jgi:AcrR family transcriptional regulator